MHREPACSSRACVPATHVHVLAALRNPLRHVIIWSSTGMFTVLKQDNFLPRQHHTRSWGLCIVKSVAGLRLQAACAISTQQKNFYIYFFALKYSLTYKLVNWMWTVRVWQRFQVPCGMASCLPPAGTKEQDYSSAGGGEPLGEVKPCVSVLLAIIRQLLLTEFVANASARQSRTFFSVVLCTETAFC